VQEPTEYARRK